MRGEKCLYSCILTPSRHFCLDFVPSRQHKAVFIEPRRPGLAPLDTVACFSRCCECCPGPDLVNNNYTEISSPWPSMQRRGAGPGAEEQRSNKLGADTFNCRQLGGGSSAALMLTTDYSSLISDQNMEHIELEEQL